MTRFELGRFETILHRPGPPAIGLLLLVLVVGACAPVGVAREPEPVPEGPALVDGDRNPDEARAAARLLSRGETLLRDGDAQGARATALEVESTYPSAIGSARALWLRARAARVLERWDEGEDAISRYLALAPSDDPLRGDGALLRARLRWEGGLGGELEALFAVPSGSRDRVLAEAQELAVELAGEMETPFLRDLVQEAPRHARILPPFLVELSVREYLTGNESRARELAQRALGLSPLPEVADRAESVLEGRVEEAVAVSVVLGALLPETSSPALEELAQAIRDGVELAVARAPDRDRRPVRFLPVDDQAEGRAAVRGIEELERQGATGIVGPVLEPLLDEVIRARTSPIPVISPTARSLPPGGVGVYSLTASGPGPSRLLARMALNREVGTAVVVHPSTSDMAAQAWWFQDAFEAGGGYVMRTLSYPPGTTSFEAYLGPVVELEPDALILLLPPEEVERVAPQIAYWGVDDLEDLLIFGNESWTSQRVLESVPVRHTNGILSVTSRGSGGELGPGWDEFEEAYEEHFMRSLRSPMPALGYDAARLLMEAAREGDGTPEGTLRAMERIRDFPGATGLISVVDGRIQRSYLPVLIENRRLMPVAP